MSTPSNDIPALHADATTGFAAFPRETRDMVFSYIATAAELRIDYHDNHKLQTNHEYDECIEMLHEWAPKSYIAKGACEALWSSSLFHHGWEFESEIIIDPHAPLYLYTGIKSTKCLGTPIDLRECVQEIKLETLPASYDLANHYLYDLAKPIEDDGKSLLKLKHELSQLRQFPHLRRVEVQIWIPSECDAYFEGMRIVESISNACAELKTRIGPGLDIWLARSARVWPDTEFDWEEGEEREYLGESHISWMWDKPSQTHRERVKEGLATADERIRVLIADGVDPGGEYSLLEELRQAGSFLPQYKDDVVEMEVFKPWMGISESYWQWIKNPWGRYEQYPRDETLDPRMMFLPSATTSLSSTTEHVASV